MSAHTPGPWLVAADGIRVGAEGGFEPFGGCGCCGSPWLTAGDEQTNLANARLIAAAPEMLAALKEAAVMLAEVFVHSPELEPYETYAAVCAAIAKATGTEH